MESTITQNGGLFAMQHRPPQKNHCPSHCRRIANVVKPMSALRTSVGEFSFRQTALGCHLDLLVGTAHWTLGLYGTNEAAVRAVKGRRTGFQPWDALKLRRSCAPRLSSHLNRIQNASRYLRSMMPCLRSIGQVGTGPVSDRRT